jgi:hypothetical protein
MDKERRIRKFALIVVDCFHKEYHRLEYNPPSTIPAHISFHFYCINYQNICQAKQKKRNKNIGIVEMDLHQLLILYSYML